MSRHIQPPRCRLRSAKGAVPRRQNGRNPPSTPFGGHNLRAFPKRRGPLRAFPESARAAGRGAKKPRNPPAQPRFGGHNLRVFPESARAAGRGAKKPKNPPAQPRFGGHNLRVFLSRLRKESADRSVEGAVRMSSGNKLAAAAGAEIVPSRGVFIHFGRNVCVKSGRVTEPCVSGAELYTL